MLCLLDFIQHLAEITFFKGLFESVWTSTYQEIRYLKGSHSVMENIL